MTKSHLKSTVKLIAGAGIAYSLFRLISRPKSRVRILPEKRIKNIHVLPNIKIARRDKEYHLHHWINAAFLYSFYLMKKRRFTGSKFFHGFMLGTILQGLTYKDRFKVIRPKLVDMQKALHEN